MEKNGLKKIVAFVLTIAMAVTMVPVLGWQAAEPAYADDFGTPIIEIGTATLTLENPYYKNGPDEGQGNAGRDSEGANVLVSRDAGSGIITVTLKDLKFKVPDDSDCGIEILTDAAFKFVITGDNYLGATSDSGTDALDWCKMNVGIGSKSNPSVVGDLTFTGDGSLTIFSSEAGIATNHAITFESGTYNILSRKQCVYAQNNLTVNGGTLNVDSEGTNTNALEVGASGTLAINGGTIEAFSKNGSAIHGGNVDVSGGQVNATSNGNYAVYAAETLTVSGGSINAGTNSMNISNGYAVWTTNLRMYGGELKAAAMTPVLIIQEAELAGGKLTLTSMNKNFSVGLALSGETTPGATPKAIMSGTDIIINHVTNALIKADFLLKYSNSDRYTRILCAERPNNGPFSIYYTGNLNYGEYGSRTPIGSGDLPLEAVRAYEGVTPNASDFISANGFLVKNGDGTTVVNGKTLSSPTSIYIAVDPMNITGTVTVDNAPASGVNVALITGGSGRTTKAAVVSAADGSFTLNNVTAGVYEIVVSTDAGVTSKICTIKNGPVDVGNINITSGKKAVVTAEVEGNPLYNDYYGIAVDGLDAIAKNTPSDGDLTVYFEVGKKNDAGTTTREAIKAKAEAYFEELNNHNAITLPTDNIDFLDIRLFKKIDAGDKEDIGTSNSAVLAIYVPYPKAGVRNNVTVLRKHGEEVEVFKQLALRPAANYKDGYFYKGADYIVIYASKFSDYAIAYSPVEISEKQKTYDLPTDETHSRGRGKVKEVVTEPAVKIETGIDRYLITDEHIAYISGGETGMVMPDAHMTRAEAVQMFYNLLKEKNVNITTGFADVKEGAWYANAANTLASMNIINGKGKDTDGAALFMPSETITRAEFIAIAMRLAYETEGKAEFRDVPETHWAYRMIAGATEYGWIGGYSDGSFMPEGMITRAEVVTIVNRILGRTADRAYIDSNFANLKQFSDLQSKTAWYFYDMVEATNTF